MTLDKNHYWTAFKYTKPLQFRTTPTLKNIERYSTITIKAKKAWIYKSAFLKPSIRLAEPPVKSPKMVYFKITEEVVF